jgi:hypothetical protein
MMIIWKAMIEYLANNLRGGRSVNIKNFGAFTFDIHTELPKIAIRNMDPNNDLSEQRLDRKHVHNVKPCFVLDTGLQQYITRSLHKEEITPAASQHSIFQKGFRMIYCNPVPIAAACLLGKDVVQDALQSIYMAAIDLVKYGRDIDLPFGFCNIRITSKKMNVVWLPSFVESCQNKGFESHM